MLLTREWIIGFTSLSLLLQLWRKGKYPPYWNFPMTVNVCGDGTPYSKDVTDGLLMNLKETADTCNLESLEEVMIAAWFRQHVSRTSWTTRNVFLLNWKWSLKWFWFLWPVQDEKVSKWNNLNYRLSLMMKISTMTMTVAMPMTLKWSW